MPRKYSFESEGDEQEPLDNPKYMHYPVPPQPQQGQQLRQQHDLDLDDPEPYYDEPPPGFVHEQQQPQRRPQQQQQALQPQQRLRKQPPQAYYEPAPAASRPAHGPAVHPDSAYNQASSSRQFSRGRVPTRGGSTRVAAATGTAPAIAPPAVATTFLPTAATAATSADAVSPISPPVPPPHYDSESRHYSGRETQYPPQTMAPSPPSNVTPGADNFSQSAAGGMAGIAYSVAERNPRESGLEAMRGLQQQQQQQQQPPQPQLPQHFSSPPPGYPQQAHQAGAAYPPQQYRGYNGPYEPPEQTQSATRRLRPYAYAGGGAQSIDRDSRSSLQSLGTSAFPPGSGTPGSRTPSRSPHGYANELYTDNPYQRYSTHDAQLGYVNPNEIEDDGDDGLEYGRSRNARASMLSLAGHSTRSGRSGGHGGGAYGPAAVGAAAVGAAAVGTAAAGGAATSALAYDAAGVDGNLAAKAGLANRVTSNGARYNAVYNNQPEYPGAAGVSGADVGPGAGASGRGGRGGFMSDDGGRDGRQEGGKSEWLASQDHSSKRWKWTIIIAFVVMVVAGIVCGVVFGVVLKHKHGGGGSPGSSESAAGDTASNGDLSINSPEIQALLNNKKLHKIFPGVDYTPINTQYPDCLDNPPSQNNVTRDIAVLSQLTNTIRLYGTDCNQTEMTIHAINQLKMQDTVKIWMGVWQDNNATTNARQLAQMWDILDKNGGSAFKGIIVANEILFRKQMTSSQLALLLGEVRTNLTNRNIDLPVATSDLGTVWDYTLAQASDYIMANIHPFFGGVNAQDAAAWTWNFWDTNNGQFFKTDTSKNVISETGWPSTGGTDCGTGSTSTSCPDAAVAGISQLNQFLSDWVCDALTNGTQYFWFEAFDEPWKISFDSGDENWEDHWGIMDVNRNLKPGVLIPDCGGKTV
ncbi:O-glycosyl hydrolase [Niveomyces insectorum RCEF 264]|uniref:glucan endo-1,3-beta-D-glucosidase n=1 Tax=Niveomyces insectorum RCEF 264 TaxID=1081102 RepID=A0A167UT58_9HYPO|nr:O-glycosyl hydrolase [Niveomyces insectorum RCEF 264]